jgi:CDP-diacylglycerol--glycerol-3-phosphate 3-phosphatidyltransferase
MFDGRWRSAVDAKTEPIGGWLQRHGITADVLTATGLISATATAVAIGLGYLHAAVFLLALTGMHDLFDGPVAKAAGSSSIRGAFFDSVTDRITDALLMGGVAWYLVSQNKGHLVLLPFAILGVTTLVSYQRAKAEALGLSAKGGLMERAERMILLGAGLLASWLLVPVLWVLLVLTTVTAIGRFVTVWKAANATLPDRPQNTRSMVLEARLREWRVRTSSEWRESRAGDSAARWKSRRLEGAQTRSRRSRRSRPRTTRHTAPPR